MFFKLVDGDDFYYSFSNFNEITFNNHKITLSQGTTTIKIYHMSTDIYEIITDGDDNVSLGYCDNKTDAQLLLVKIANELNRQLLEYYTSSLPNEIPNSFKNLYALDSQKYKEAEKEFLSL